MVFTGPEIEELRDAIVDAFDENALVQTVLFKLGKMLFKLVPHENLKTVAFKLITLSEEEGWVRSLVFAVVLVRPDNDMVKAFCNDHAPWAFSPPDPSELISKVTKGIGAVTAKKSDPNVQKIINRFRDDLQAACDGATALNKYKKLHDRLHIVQIMFSQQLASAAQEARHGEITAPLDLYAYQLRDNSVKARAEAKGLPTEILEIAWANTLVQIANLVEKGQAGPGAALDRAGVLLQSVLSEATRINAKLTELAGGLRLGGLVEALQLLEPVIGDSAAEVRSALEGLSLLRPRLDGLMREHFEWQVLDRAFSLAEHLPGSTLTERFPEWDDTVSEASAKSPTEPQRFPGTQSRLLNLFDLSQTKTWAEMLRKQIVELQAAGAAGNATRFERAFDTFRVVARDRFVDVDTELLDQSRSLAEMAPALTKLL